MSRLQRFHYHALEDEATGPRGVSAPATTFRGAAPAELEEMDPTDFNSDVDAARFYLDALLSRDARPAMRSIVEPTAPENVPDLELLDDRDSPATGTRVVRFTQRHDSIPVFGSHAVVELTPERALVSADASLDEVGNLPPVPSLEPREALAAIAKLTNESLALEILPPPELVYYKDDDDGWHLAWHLREVPAAPPDDAAEPVAPDRLGGHLPAPSPRDRPQVGYLVDAHDGEVLFYYSSTPTLNGVAGVPAVPVRLRGVDEDGQEEAFWGNNVGSAFAMHDPLRQTKTYDFSFADIESNAVFPDDPVSKPQADWLDSHPGAVSAHVNAQRVHDFYKGILQRNGIDDGGMTLISVVNCTARPAPGSREWPNAFWWQQKMWYGQQSDGTGRLRSMARYLDVIAHELTHGVISHSSKLVYRNESGALDESFSDVFGVVINNWYRQSSDRTNVTTWTWEIGSGYRSGGLPLRDLSDPTRTGDPDHYSQRHTGSRDWGGVHINSGIHNKAVHNLLTDRVPDGSPRFPVEEAAVLLYLAMTRLPPLATFADARLTLETVTRTYFSGDIALCDQKLAAIGRAYDAVGIGPSG